MNTDRAEIEKSPDIKSEIKPETRHQSPPLRFESLIAAGLLVLALGLAYGPDKIEGHSIYGGVVQDVTNLYGFYCWDEFSRSELMAGRFPLWNPHNAFGVPHLANMQSAVFYPLNWLKWAFGFWPVIDALLMLRLFIAGFFTWLFARRALRLSFWPALTAAVAFMLTGYFTRFVYMSHLNVEVLLPLELLLMHRLVERRSAGSLIFAGLGFALLILGGFPEATLYAFSLSIAYYLFAIWKLAPGRALPRVGLLAASLALGLIISLPQWLPFAEYYAQAWTYHGAASGVRHHDPRLMISLLLPWFFGVNNLSPVSVFLHPYLGVIPALLSLFALARLRSIGPSAVFFLAAALCLLGLVYGVPPFSWLGRLPLFNLTYNDKYAAPALALALALAAGAGLERLSKEKSWKLLLLIALALLVVIGINVALGYRNGFKPVWALGLLKPGFTLTGALILAIAGGLAFLPGRGQIPGKTLAAAMCTLCLAGLAFDSLGNTPVYHDSLAADAAKLSHGLAPSNGEFRVYADPDLDDVFPDRLLSAGVDDIRSYEPLYPRSYVDYMAQVNGLSGGTLMAHYNKNMIFAVDRDHLDDQLLNLANTVIYMFDLPLDERPLARDWAEQAVTVSPRRESWLRAEEVVAGGEARLSLLDHAPVRVQSPALPEKARGFLFSAALPDHEVFAGGEKGDGVSLVITDDLSSPSLLFARYLDPKLRVDELGWKSYSLRLITLGANREITRRVTGLTLALLPGPRNNAVRDAAALGLPRLKEAGSWPEMKPVPGSKGPVHVYQDQAAFPRVWWTMGFSTPTSDASYFEELHKTVNSAPMTLLKIALLRRAPSLLPPNEKAQVKKPSVRLAAYASGAITIEAAEDSPGFIVAAEQYLPGWRASRQGGGERVEAQVIPADGPFMAVPVPAGEWKIEFIYRPLSFQIGLWAALASLAAMLIIISARQRQKVLASQTRGL